MKFIFIFLFIAVSLSLSSCASPPESIYRSTASAPHEATSVKTTLIPIPSDQWDVVKVFAAVDVTKESNIPYILFAPMGGLKTTSDEIHMEHAVSLMPSDAQELISTIQAIDESQRSSDPHEKFIRFVSKTQLSVLPTSTVANDQGHVAVKVESIGTPVWVPSVELTYTHTDKERSVKLWLADEGWSDVFLFKGQSDLMAFRDKISRALTELNNLGGALK